MISLEAVWDLLGALLLLGGASFMFVSGVGLLRLRDTYSRMHASAKTQWLGVFLMTAGAAVSMRSWQWVAAALLIVALQTVSSPIGSQLMARATYRNQEFEAADLVVDELLVDNEQAEAIAIKHPRSRDGFARPRDYPDLDSSTTEAG
ncbi:monovalent cation/H(+) antiporter subunit G [Actinomyces sp. S4-C9]|uniref:monovalent cation/H(+) antiporter subunit G n=1 Tax=Actinomyces sp. S4-C9 TaxID=1219581 RepID=UPI00068E2BEF|nr:monovalent cation/H(+) antiporter subunit G [Actinomyces sp. S4-C9]